MEAPKNLCIQHSVIHNNEHCDDRYVDIILNILYFVVWVVCLSTGSRVNISRPYPDKLLNYEHKILIAHYEDITDLRKSEQSGNDSK